MRIIFAGTPAFAAASLKVITRSRHQVAAVLTQPDRPSGRGRKLNVSDVKQLAIDNGLKVLQPVTLKDSETQALLASLSADLMVVVAYGLLLPQAVLSIPKRGCVNIHASLLPRWRGAAPIQRAIEAGDSHTGISIMQMDAGLDTGDVIRMQSLPIKESDTASSLHDKLAELGAAVIVETLDQIESGDISLQPQDESGACYAEKLSRNESFVDWRQSARSIVRKIHAFNPWPSAKTHYNKTELKLHRATTLDTDTTMPPASVVNSHKRIIIKSADECVEIIEIQKPGGRVMTAEEFLNGFELTPGTRLG